MGDPRRALFAVTHREEFGPVGPHIPTLGFAASASDMYRVAQIVSTGHEGYNSCHTDVATCNGLAKLVEGEVRSMQDLGAAEAALQVLMWHDRVDVLVPGFKSDHGNGLVMYSRADEVRSQLAFDLFRSCDPFDQMFVVERVRVDQGTVVESTLPGSGIVGKALEEAKLSYLDLSPLQAATLAAMPIEMRIPAYFSDPRIEASTARRGFFGQFYSTLEGQWWEAMSVVPDVDAAIPLPPLVSIVLTRAPSRSAIPATIEDLRAELQPVRLEMSRLSQVVQGARAQSEIETQIKEARGSFAAAFPASRYPTPSALLPLLRLYKAAKTPFDVLIRVLSPGYQPQDPRIIANRTVTGRTFAKLLATDSMHSLVTNFFSDAEIANLERSRIRPPGK